MRRGIFSLAWVAAATLIGCDGSTNTAPQSTNQPAATTDAAAMTAVEEAPAALADESAERITPITLADFRAAAAAGQIEPIRQGIAQGLQVGAADETGRTALMLAAFDGHTAIVDLLLENDAAIDAKDVSARTALMYAASGPNNATVRRLLDAGAKVNLADNQEGFTALMFAAAEGQTEICKMLLAKNADRNAKDVDGDTALSFAEQNNQPDVVRLLSK